MSFRNIFVEQPCRLSYSGGYLVARKDDGTVKVHISEITSIIVSNTQSSITTFLLSELSKNDIPLIYCDEHYLPVGIATPFYGTGHSQRKINEQLSWSEPVKKQLWKEIVKMKITRQARLLEDSGEYSSAKQLYEYADDVRSGDIDNREGIAARTYFPAIFGDGFSREQSNDINSSLNYGYIVLMSLFVREIAARGYLTQLGIFHHNQLNNFNFACDLMEPFRIIVDSILVEILNNGNDIIFDTGMKHKMANLSNIKILYNGGEYKATSAINLYVTECFRILNKEIKSTELIDYELL